MKSLISNEDFICGELFLGKRQSRFPRKRTGPSAARKVFFRGRGSRKNDCILFAPAAQTPAEGETRTAPPARAIALRLRRVQSLRLKPQTKASQSFAARTPRNNLKSFFSETAFSKKIPCAERSVRAQASAWSAAKTIRLKSADFNRARSAAKSPRRKAQRSGFPANYRR